MLGADELVLQPLGFGLGGVRDLAKARRERRLRSAVGGGLFRQLGAQLIGDGLRLDAHLAQQRRDDAVSLLDEREQQMLGLDLRVVPLLGEPLRRQDRFLRLLGVLVQFICSSPLRITRASAHSLTAHAAELLPPASFASAS